MTNVMTPEHWRKIEDIFNRVVEAEPPAQAALLKQLCDGDEALRREIEALVGCTSADDFLQNPIHEAARSLPLRDETNLIGQRIGAYHILKQLGQGGMGAVYLAERDDAEYYRQVALKIVKRGMDSRFVLNRFRVERQILATLEHPNIAQLLDGGSTPEGLPYFVMEYVAGQPLTEYCHTRQLSIEERLRLFLPVCAAVQHAHQKLIVHRDLKPSNILVTAAQNGKEGTPKLLDFGIAKLLDPSLSPIPTPRTLTSVRLMTPDYASPEQVRGLPISTASDVYSLGAVLYELLSGERPHRFGAYTPAEIERAVCDTAIERPSAVAQRTTNAGTRTHKQLAGDLDNIVMMALRKEPERRYQSVEQFAEDIRRYLAGHPIAAHSESLTYRAGKFVGRHKLAVAAVALIFLSLLGGIAATARAARRAQAERARAEVNLAAAQAARTEAEKQRAEADRQRLSAEAQRTEALTQRARAEAQTIEAQRQRFSAEMQRRLAETQQARAERRFAQVRKLANTFLFDFHDKIAPLAGSTEAREMVVKTALEYLDSLAQEAGNDPVLSAELAVAYAKVGDVQGLPGRANLGQSKAALENYAKSVRLNEKLLEKDAGNEAVRRTLATTFNTIGLLKLIGGAFAAAKQNALQSLAVAGRLPLNNHAEPENFRVRARPHDLLQRLAQHDYNAAEALRQAQQLVAIYEQLALVEPGVRSQRALTAGYDALATGLAQTGDLAGAERARRQAVSIAEALVSTQPADAPLRQLLAVHYSQLAELLAEPAALNLERPAEAVAYLRKTMALYEELAASDAKDRMTQARLALTYQQLGRYLRPLDAAESVRILKKAHERAPQTAAPGRPATMSLFTRLNLAQSEWLAGDRQTAQENLRLAQQTLREKNGPAPEAPPHFYYLEIGKLLQSMGKAGEALEYLQQGLSLLQQFISERPTHLPAQADLADCYASLGKHHALQAARADLPMAKQLSAWQDARHWYQKSLAIWQAWPKQAPSLVFNQSRTEAVKQALANCDGALAGLAAKQQR